MLGAISTPATRFRIILTRLLAPIGFRDSGFLMVVALLIGVIAAAAAVAFHQIIDSIEHVYSLIGPDRLYGWGLPLLIVFPATGGLLVGIISKKIMHVREGHGVLDVMESVIRSNGFVKPRLALEQILTTAISIGSGGSIGAEAPIIQIGAGIASGVGQIFGIARQSMPIVIACGTAAGVSAIFNAPIGGLLFTLEVILQDFSVRTITPVVIASVIAEVTTQAIFRNVLHERTGYQAIFRLPTDLAISVTWPQLVNFAILGLLCGLIALALIRLMGLGERLFHKLPVPPFIRPGIGGMMVGVTGVLYVLVFGRWLLHTEKPIPFIIYPMPAFFADGYPAIRYILSEGFYTDHAQWFVALLLAALTIIHLCTTCMTVCSGGGGGVIAPALFLGATGGGLLGLGLQATHFFPQLQPEVYALVGMAGVLAACVHAPLSAILIMLELTKNNDIVMPAMITSIVATGFARSIYPDSVYTLGLRQRGIRLGATGDMMVLRRITVEQVNLEPASVLQEVDPFQRVLDLSSTLGSQNFIVIDKKGSYIGMVTSNDINLALLDRDAVPLLLVAELMRKEVPFVRTSDDLATVLDVFSRFDVSHLPVCLPNAPGKIIGLISRAGLMRQYQSGLAS
ncbi:MAG: chloride channel protein [Phycisphaerae bacterium]|nr:chloride channel protein [Phycisphaerae bacterium]